MSADDAFAEFLDAMGWPYDVTITADDGSPIVPPLEVLDRLVALRTGQPLHGDDVDAIRWTIEAELGVTIWPEGAR